MTILPPANITLDLDLLPKFCNNWPELSITVNNNILWQDYVKEPSRVTVAFTAEESNCVRISYLNKMNGPEIWDTKIDDDGNIIEDQNCILTNVLINQARCKWIPTESMWTYLDGSTKFNYGFMDLQGCMEFSFPRDVYQWIIEKRQSNGPANTKKSSLDYKSIYIPQNENIESRAIINDINKLLETLNV
jgi:hypothetical protein